MHEAHSAKQAETDQTRYASVQKPARAQELLQRTIDPSRLAFYDQLLGHRPPTGLRLSPELPASTGQPIQHRVEKAIQQEPTSTEEEEVQLFPAFSPREQPEPPSVSMPPMQLMPGKEDVAKEEGGPEIPSVPEEEEKDKLPQDAGREPVKKKKYNQTKEGQIGTDERIWPSRRRSERAVSPLETAERMLNRLARIMNEAVPNVSKTIVSRNGNKRKLTSLPSPHLALVLHNGSLYIAGNTGFLRQEELNLVWGKVKAIVNGREESNNTRDSIKLRALVDGSYIEDFHIKDRDALESIRAIIKGDNTPTLLNARLDGGEQYIGSEAIHGEMAVLDQIYDDYKATSVGEATSVQVIYIGGVKLDCLWCHWAHAIFNAYFANEQKIRIATSGTHGTSYPNWRAPKWMQEIPEALKDMQSKVKGYKDPEGYRWEMHNSVVKKMNKDNPKRTKKDLMPPPSESEYEELMEG